MKQSLLLICMLFIASALMAQPGPKIGFGVHGNLTMSNLPGPAIAGSASLDDAYGTGWGAGAHADVSLIVVGFRLSADYMKYSLDEDRFRSSYAGIFGGAVNQISIEGGGLSIFSINANGKWNILPLPVVTPYLTGGIGLAWLSVDETKTSIAGTAGNTFPSRSEGGKTSFNIGAGTDFSLGLTLFVEVKYVWIVTDGENSTYVPVTIGLTF